jgi:hypothetical protein
MSIPVTIAGAAVIIVNEAGDRRARSSISDIVDGNSSLLLGLNLKIFWGRLWGRLWVLMRWVQLWVQLGYNFG